MMNDPFDDAALDREIDDAASALTSGAPRSGFEARVLARIERRHAPRRWAWQLAAAAVLVLLAIAHFAWQTRTPEAPRSAPTLAAAPAPPPAPGPQLDRGAGGGASVPGSGARAHSGRAARARAVVRVSIDEAAPQIAALTPMPELHLEPIEVTEITIPPLEPEKEPR